MNYNNYINSKSWFLKKKEIYAQKGYFCERCGENRKGFINVHHKHYRTLGDETKKDVAILCRNCHSEYHKVFGKEPDEFTSNNFITWKFQPKTKKKIIIKRIKPRLTEEQRLKRKRVLLDYRIEKQKLRLDRVSEFLTEEGKKKLGIL